MQLKKVLLINNEENIKKLCETVISEYLHQPATKLKSISKDLNSDTIVGTVQSVFGIDTDTNSLNK